MKIPAIKTNVFAVSVKFKQANGWSNEYTYKSTEPVAPDALVVVPNAKTLAAVGRVKSCTNEYTFNPNINYKYILCVLDTTVEEIREILK